MSRNFKNNASSTKFCKVCQDAGKSEDIYRSHFTRETRDPNSKVTCPTLLALECRFCYKNGHTVKYCSVLKEKDRQKPRENVSFRARKPVEEVKVSKPINQYACLESDSEEEEQKVSISIKPIESFPQLSRPAKPAPTSSNYAAALSFKPISAPVPKPVSEQVANYSAPKLAPWVTSAETQSAPVTGPLPPPIRRPMRSWADDSDSEDEEDIVPVAAPAPMNLPKDFKVVIPVFDDDW
jgi:hypothetical protein